MAPWADGEWSLPSGCRKREVPSYLTLTALLRRTGTIQGLSLPFSLEQRISVTHWWGGLSWEMTSGLWGQGCLHFPSQPPGFQRQVMNATVDGAIVASLQKKTLSRLLCRWGELLSFLYHCFLKKIVFTSGPRNRMFNPNQLSWVKYTASPVCPKMLYLPCPRWHSSSHWIERLLSSQVTESPGPVTNMRKQVSNSTDNNNHKNYHLFLRA